MVKDLETTK